MSENANLFGDADAAEVPDNPFYVAPDTYFCTLAEVTRVEKKDGSGEGLSFKWVIEDEGEYEGNNVQDWKNIHPDVPQDEWTPAIRKDNARLKQRLLEMGVAESEMNGLLDNLESLQGLQAYLTVVETTDKNDPTKTYTNIKSVRLDD